MPVLLAPDQAPTLHELLASANTIGLDWSLVDNDKQPEPRIRGLGSLLSATPDEISFLSNPRLSGQLQHCQAAAVIMTEPSFQQLDARHRPYDVVLCSQPYLLYALLAQWFDQHRL